MIPVDCSQSMHRHTCSSGSGHCATILPWDQSRCVHGQHFDESYRLGAGTHGSSNDSDTTAMQCILPNHMARAFDVDLDLDADGFLPRADVEEPPMLTISNLTH